MHENPIWPKGRKESIYVPWAILWTMSGPTDQTPGLPGSDKNPTIPTQQYSLQITDQCHSEQLIATHAMLVPTMIDGLPSIPI